MNLRKFHRRRVGRDYSRYRHVDDVRIKECLTTINRITLSDVRTNTRALRGWELWRERDCAESRLRFQVLPGADRCLMTTWFAVGHDPIFIYLVLHDVRYGCTELETPSTFIVVCIQHFNNAFAYYQVFDCNRVSVASLYLSSRVSVSTQRWNWMASATSLTRVNCFTFLSS